MSQALIQIGIVSLFSALSLAFTGMMYWYAKTYDQRRQRKRLVEQLVLKGGIE